MTDAEKRESARMLYYRWKDRGQENADDQSFWFDILQDLIGLDNVSEKISFQKPVTSPRGTTLWIDAYIPGTRVLIEQKSKDVDLGLPQAGHNGKTPYEQAKEYDDCLPVDEKARWIILSNFTEFWIYDMSVPFGEPVVVLLSELQTKYETLDILVRKEQKTITKEIQLSLKAGDLVGKIHDRFLEQYSDPMAKHTQRSLNILCVRLVFCLYAEDAGLFGEKDAFSGLLSQYEPKDMRRVLLDLFKVLDTPISERADLYLDDELASFPYVNGGLFREENIVIPKITQEIKDTLLESAKFDWREISPTIFGAVFESTLNPETRRAGGMHYTSIENIHKVIDPLFLDGLKAELDEIKAIEVKKTKETKLKQFQDKLATLKFFDPACGSGNFLTETYVSIRRLENQVLFELNNGQISLAFTEEGYTPIKVNIGQFYGIEINDFAVTVAKTALWIAESQMMKETEDVVHANIEFLPLKTNASIVEGNALDIPWEKVVPKNELSYIMGNPPFIGASMMSDEQKAEATLIYGNKKLSNSIDYVGAWYYKASELMYQTDIRAAFVSTNSITQGEQVEPLWGDLLKKGLVINYAYRTFVWNSEANQKAKVHCVIIGFSYINNKDKKIYTGELSEDASCINPYLTNAPNVLITSRTSPICDVPRLTKGNQATDDGNFIFSEEEAEQLLSLDENARKYIRRYVGAKDFLNNNEVRYCMWLKNISPSEYKSNRIVMKRLQNIRDFREKSSAAPTRKSAEKPFLFFSTPQTDEPYLIIPRVSSERRRYIPIGFMTPDVIASDSCSIVCGATMYHFGILTSNVHMAWMRVVAGRLKSDYRYSGGVVYNNFPWPTPSDEQCSKIEQTAQAILDARALYPDSSLADLYDPLTMPIELTRAHQKNDVAVMSAYGFDIKNTSETDCVAELMKLYQKLTRDT